MGKKYVEDFKGNIYLVKDDYYLKISPTKNGEDRRYNNIIVKKGLSKHVAREMVHLQHSLVKEKWIYQGEHFEAKKCLKDYDDSTSIIKELPFHNAEFLYCENRYKLFTYNGQLVYSAVTQYFPRCQMYSLDGRYCGWTTMKWLKPVYNVSQKKWV